MQMLSLSGLFGPPPAQARFRDHSAREWRMTELVRELTGLAGLLGWLGVLFYLIAALSGGLT